MITWLHYRNRDKIKKKSKNREGERKGKKNKTPTGGVERGRVSQFESDVVPDSGKTTKRAKTSPSLFESDVVPDSGKTTKRAKTSPSLFESDAVSDGGKIKAGQDGILRIAAEDTDLAPVCSGFAMWICTICTK